jgi:hypothetical protein
MNLFGRGKRKFVLQSHVLKKNNAVIGSDTEKRAIGKTDNVKTSAARQARKKLGIDPVGEADSFPYSQTFHP